MNFYEQNRKELIEYRNNIIEKLDVLDAASFSDRPEQLFSETAINGEEILMLQKDGNIVRMNSSYHPTNEAKIWAEQYSLSNLNNVVVMFGLGNGLFAGEIAAKLRKDDFLFIYEPCIDIFLYVLNNFDITKLLKNENVIISIEGVNDFEFHNLLQNATHITNMSTQIQCAHPYYNNLFRKSNVKFWKEIKDTMLHTKININTEVVFGQRMINNGLKNLKYMKDSNCLEDFTGDLDLELPAIIVAAGPSLAENIEELKRAKGKAYVFVVDRILDYVLDNGVEPDFVVTIDPIKPVEYFTTRKDVNIPLLSEPVSNSNVLEVHKGRKIMYGCNAFFQAMYKKIGIEVPDLCTGASVATATFAICIRLGFNKIVLVGQDLAYDGQFTHAGGVAEEVTNGGETNIMTEGVDGNMVRTRYDWYEFLVWFKDIMILYPNIEVIDTKAKGAKIQGSTLMPLKEVIDTYCTKSTGISEIMSTKPATLDEERLKKTIEFFDECKEDLYDIKKKAKEAIKLCDSQLREYRRNNDESKLTIKNNNRLSKINKQMYEKPIYAFVDFYVTALTVDHIAKMYHLTDDDNQNKRETYEKSKIIYEAILEGVEYTEPKFRKAVEEFISMPDQQFQGVLE